MNTTLLSRAQAAERLGISVATMNAWASYGRPALPYIRIGRLAKYDPADIDAFIAARSGTSATEIRTRIAGVTPTP